MNARHTYSLDEIKDMLLARVDQVADQYAPPLGGAYTDKGKYFTLNPGRADRRVGSFVIDLRRGRWNDYATGQFGDLLDLIALSLNLELKDALREARQFLGLQHDSPEDIARRKAAAAEAAKRREQAERDWQAKAEKTRARAHALWLSGREQLRGTPVDHYLQTARRVDLARLGRTPRVLRYVPECFYRHVDDETGEVFEGRYPAMVALVQDVKGRAIACHRTWLAINADGRWDKAPVPKAKKVLGLYGGGHIPIWKGTGPRGGKPAPLTQAPPGQHVYISEGIEDAMSAVDLLPDIRVLAAISLSNMAAIELPACVDRVTLIADQDQGDGPRAELDRAVATHQAAGREVFIFRNRWGGKDLNDALRAAREGAA